MALDTGRSPERGAGLVAVAGFAVLSVYFTGFFPPFGNPNELSRLEAVYAFVEQGTFSIDGAIPVLGNHEDKAISGGHLYSNKAPGLTFAAIPVYRALRVFVPGPRVPWDAVFVLVRILTVSLVFTLALARFVARLPPVKGAGLVVFAVAFGTPLLFYGRSFFGHAWTAALLFLAWDLLKMSEERSGASRSGWLVVAAGFVAGWASISEYTAALLALLLALRAAARGSWKALALVAAGAAVPLLLLLAYDAACFGSPWVLSSAREAHPEFARLAGRGLFGFGPPDPRVARDFLFHPARGLLLFSPFALWILPGFAAWWRSRQDRADCVFALAAVAGLFVVLAGYPNWHGGWALGDRYLLPAAFFGGLAAARALVSPASRGLFTAAAVFSALNHFFFSASWPYFSLDLPWPVATGSLWFLSRGWIAPNLLSRAGWISLLAPSAIVAAAGWAAVRAARPLSPRPLLSASIGVALFAAAAAWAPEPAYDARLLRAGIYGRFSGQDPERRELQRAIASASTPPEKRRGMAAWRQYGK